MYSPLQLEVDVISCLVPVPLAFSENLIGALANYLSQWNAIGSTGKSRRKVYVLSWPRKEGREKITYEGDCGRASDGEYYPKLRCGVPYLQDRCRMRCWLVTKCCNRLEMQRRFGSGRSGSSGTDVRDLFGCVAEELSTTEYWTILVKYLLSIGIHIATHVV